jgi:hypothetical protein
MSKFLSTEEYVHQAVPSSLEVVEPLILAFSFVNLPRLDFLSRLSLFAKLEELRLSWCTDFTVPASECYSFHHCFLLFCLLVSDQLPFLRVVSNLSPLASDFDIHSVAGLLKVDFQRLDLGK